ncbi:uncharacterized protein E0L32_004029 [Thyridium curvatum]|uniref:Uncharacterized protein n=1 Tax=Thyridium curvatum TaxID=1093900 RepID=A0A507BIG5_9PEZI|nr:uncharacterized protein E0L32_004029 [Thyridium curvatum]TPX16380.1 hypothetical protein E0L32_004029 [Thyridium curvatum]
MGKSAWEKFFDAAHKDALNQGSWGITLTPGEHCVYFKDGRELRATVSQACTVDMKNSGLMMNLRNLAKSANDRASVPCTLVDGAKNGDGGAIAVVWKFT